MDRRLRLAPIKGITMPSDFEKGFIKGHNTAIETTLTLINSGMPPAAIVEILTEALEEEVTDNE